MTVAPGDIVQFDNLDATSGKLTANSKVEAIRTLDFGLVNPIVGFDHYRASWKCGSWIRR
jgi:acetamidase/formamidase